MAQANRGVHKLIKIIVYVGEKNCAYYQQITILAICVWQNTCSLYLMRGYVGIRNSFGKVCLDGKKERNRGKKKYTKE